jgi:biopolymer transport protein ExbD
MAFGSFGSKGSAAPMSEINIVPLVDVMMVLLVIFLVTAPLLSDAVKINLPRASSAPLEQKPDQVTLSIDDRGQAFWNGQSVDSAALDQKLAAAAGQQPQPELQLRADARTPYQRLAEIMSSAARAGVSRIGFVTDPSGSR